MSDLRIDFVERAQSVVVLSLSLSIALLLPSRSVLSPTLLLDSAMPLTRTITRRSWTTTRCGSEEEGWSRFFLLPRWWNTSSGDWLASHGSDITTAGNSGASGGEKTMKERKRERKSRPAWKEEGAMKKERVRFARRVGRTEQTDRSLIYGDHTSDIWTGSRRKFGTPRLSSSKCIERCPAARLQTGRFARGHPPRALSYELNSVFLLSCKANAGTRRYYRFYGGTMGRPNAVNIWLP